VIKGLRFLDHVGDIQYSGALRAGRAGSGNGTLASARRVLGISGRAEDESGLRTSTSARRREPTAPTATIDSNPAGSGSSPSTRRAISRPSASQLVCDRAADAAAQPGYRFSVFFHKPFLTCGDTGQNDSARAHYQPLFGVRGAARASGTVHGYERFEMNGVTASTAGGGRRDERRRTLARGALREASGVVSRHGSTQADHAQAAPSTRPARCSTFEGRADRALILFSRNAQRSPLRRLTLKGPTLRSFPASFADNIGRLLPPIPLGGH
jgi:hypothetical protein